MTLSLEEIKERISQLSPEVRRQLDIACAADKKRKALNEKQVMAQALFDSTCRHVLLWGGSRSGKTAIIIRDIVTRALKVKSRHVVLRYRFNHVKQTIIFDTLPRVFEFFFPGLWDQCHLNKSDWYLQLPNGSQIWFGGLDDKQRTEKILGSEFSSMFFNECSEIPYASRNIAITRLAQNSGLPLKAYYDCNPPSEAHWTHRMFVQKVDPDTRVALRDQDSYANLQINPVDNRDNLPEEYFAELEAQSGRNRQRFLYGQWGSVTDNPLWTLELLDRCRELETKQEMVRMIVAVDPSGCSGDEDKRSDEVGIVVVGLDRDGKGYLLEDLSGRYSPKDWGKISVDAYQRHSADCIVAEVNYGGAMVAEVIRAAASDSGLAAVPFREVHATRGKVVRAEPISALYEQGKVRHVGYFAPLEEQLCAMSMSGYAGSRSPDRADALIWALTALFPGMTSKPPNRSHTGRPKVVLKKPSYRNRNKG